MLPNSYVAVDIETTGLNPKTDKIIELAAVKVLEGQNVEEKTTLVDPRRELPEAICRLTGIHDEMLKDAPDIGRVIGEYVDFCEGLPLLGHNIRFDHSFLKRAAVDHDLVFDKQGYDTLKLCRRFMPGDLSKSLGSACAYYQVPLDTAHRALGDARAAHALYQVLEQRYKEQAPEAFSPIDLTYRTKKAQPATKRQKEVLQELIKYHKIKLTVQIDDLSRNEISRLTDRIISQYGRIIKR